MLQFAAPSAAPALSLPRSLSAPAAVKRPLQAVRAHAGRRDSLLHGVRTVKV